MQREENTQYILSLSYGKDSIACLEAIKQLGYPLDRIVHAEIYATDDIPADLPPMVAFKKHADKIILERYGIEVEHVCAMEKDSNGGGDKHTSDASTIKPSQRYMDTETKDFPSHAGLGVKISKHSQSNESKKLTYEKIFYRIPKRRNLERESSSKPYGFPIRGGNWCTALKQRPINQHLRIPIYSSQGESGNGMVSQIQNGCTQIFKNAP